MTVKTIRIARDRETRFASLVSREPPRDDWHAIKTPRVFASRLDYHVITLSAESLSTVQTTSAIYRGRVEPATCRSAGTHTHTHTFDACSRAGTKMTRADVPPSKNRAARRAPREAKFARSAHVRVYSRTLARVGRTQRRATSGDDHCSRG